MNRKFRDGAKRQLKKVKSRSRSLSRRRDWDHRRSRGWSPSPSHSRSPEPRHFTPSWTPPRMMNQSVRPQNLTVILPNDSSKKRKEKRKKQEKRIKETSDKQKKRKRNEKSPPPSKEVFASGNNILVSVSFNKDNEEKDGRPKRRRDSTNEELTTKRMRKEKEKQVKTKKVKRKVKATSNVKPVAIIDLDRSPFKELTPPTDVIILSDSDNADSNGMLGLQKSHRRDTSEQTTSPKAVPTTNYMNSMGPKTPPEPQVKFSFNAKQSQLRAISNPLHEPEDVEEEIDPQEELENRLNEVMHKGPNTPPEPPNSPPSSPDAYDPFDPTKSRTPTPEPKLTSVQSSGNQCEDEVQEDVQDRSIVIEINDKGTTPTTQSSTTKSHTPPLSSADIQPADSQSSVRAITPDVTITSSPERPVGIVMNQIVQPQVTVFPTVVSKPVASSIYSSGTTSLITATPVSSHLNISRINILNSSLITPTTVTSSIPQRIVLPNITRSSPINKVSPSKTPIKLTPIKPMPSKNPVKVSGTNIKSTWKSKNRNLEGNDLNLDFESPYSPGSSDYEDLFEPPPDMSNIKTVQKPTQTTKNTKSPAKNQSMFDSLFGSSPVHQYANKNKNKNKGTVKSKKTNQHTSKGKLIFFYI